jgi:thiol-disulfide isomerase/thioredoxin
MLWRRRSWLDALPALAGARAAAHQLRDWPADRKPPPLRLPDLDGRIWDLAELRGRPVLLNFWASWCEPCRGEMPSLEMLAQRRTADGLRVLTVNYQDGERSIRSFLERTPMDLPVLLDRDGAATRAWTPRLFPSSVLIAASGQPRRLVLGEVNWGGAEAGRWMDELSHHQRVPTILG